MPETGTREVSRHEFSIAYDGAAIAAAGDHSIDVQTLAPALLAFGKLIREANTEFNGKKSTAKVLVVSDFEHKCFNINFEVIVSWLQQLQTLLGDDTVKTAKDVLERLGLLGAPPATAVALHFLGFLKTKDGRKVVETKELIDADRSGIVQVKFEGDGNTVNVHNHIYHLSENPRALRATRDEFLPLGQDGFDNVKIRHGEDVLQELEWESVKSIIKSCNVGIEESKEQPDPEIPAWLSIYSPVYDVSASMWRFRLGKEVIYADITATTIAQETIERGGIGVEDAFLVKLEITTEVDKDGKKEEPTYKILEVLRFVPAGPAPRQASLFGPGES